MRSRCLRRSSRDGRRSARARRAVRGLLRGTLAVGTMQCLGAVNLPAILARFHASHPGVQIELRQGGSTDLIERVRTGDLDLAFVCAPTDGASGVAFTAVAEESLLLACSPRSEEHTSELQSHHDLVCRLLL